VTIEIAGTGKIGHPFQLAVERIRPAVIGAAQVSRRPFSLGHNGGRMMAAHVEECADAVIRATDGDDGLLGDVTGDEPSGLVELFDPSGDLPRADEDGPTLQIENAGIRVPAGRNGRCVLERQMRIVSGDDVAQRMHAQVVQPATGSTSGL
jgi:hypothetical protein